MKLSNPFSRRWLLPTLFVIAGVFVLVKLGLWQLDRLDQRRAFNAYVVSRWDQEPFDLSENSLPADLAELEYRRVQLEGDLDYENQVVLKNQNRNGAPGVNLVTPLLLDENRAILIARGWVPLSESTPDRWSQFEAPTDTPIVGMLQESQILPGAKPPDAPQTEWFRIDIDAIQRQLPYELLPVFVWQLPEPGRSYSALPYREVPFEITEGNHFSYAIQWFMFAAILGFGYFPYMSYFDARRQRVASMPDLGAPAQPMPDAVGHNGKRLGQESFPASEEDKVIHAA